MTRYAAFISYAHRYRDWVGTLQRNLERCLVAEGREQAVFLDQTDLGSGRSWVSQLEEGIERSDHLVLVATPEALASPRVEDEWHAFVARRRDWSRGHLHVALLVDCPLPAFLDKVHHVDFREHDETRYREALERLAAGILVHAPRDLSARPEGLEIPALPPSRLRADLRRRLVAWLEPLMENKKDRRYVATALGLERNALDGLGPASAASTAVVLHTGDDDPREAAIRVAGILADELDEDEDRERLSELAELRSALDQERRGGGEKGLVGVWLRKVVRDHERLVPYFQQRTELDLLDRVYVQLELSRGTRFAAVEELKSGHAKTRLDQPRTLRSLLDLEPEKHPWVTRRWAVLGDPGAGKTTLLRHLAATLARESPPVRVPVFESLPRLLREPEWLLDRLERQLRRAGEDVRGLAGALERAGQEGRLLLLLDGLDEVPREVRSEAEETLRSVADRWPATPVVVTSRPIGYRRLGAGFRELELLPFDGRQRREFLARWFGRAAGRQERRRAEEAARSLENDSTLNELSGNPLYLTLMALLIEKGTSPASNRPRLYDQVFDLLMSGEHRPEGQRLAMDHPRAVRGVLRHLGEAMTRENRDSEPAAELEARLYQPELDALRATLERVPRWRQGMRFFLDDLADRTGILGPHDGPQADWRFWHRTFREALASEALAERFHGEGEAAILEHTRVIAGDESRWAEPYALVAGRVDDPDALVRSLVVANRALGLHAVATAQGLRDETLREILELSDDWRERRKVYERLPELIDDPERALALLDELRRRTRNGNDLFFLEGGVAAVARRRPDAERLVTQLQVRFYEHVPTPSEELFRWIETPEEGRVELWREIPAGEFRMGSPEGEGNPDEHPRHCVKVASPFVMGAVPVTNAQYAAFDPGHKPHAWEGISEDELRHHPVESVTWYEAVAFCRWLSAAFAWARGARLPIEEEWEYASRAGTETRFWSGDGEKDLERVGWYDGNAEGRTHRVGEKPANLWGLYDVHGNVLEWMSSVWTGDDYSSRRGGIQIDPWVVERADSAAATGGDRVMRGGCCWDSADWTRSACRNIGGPEVEGQVLGFRVVLPRGSAAPSD